MNKIFVALSFFSLIVLGCMDPAKESELPLKTVNLLAIPGIIVPATGATPVTTPIDTAQYTGTITWSPAHGTFAASTVYTAHLLLTPKSGYTLSGVAANSFTREGATLTHSADSGGITAIFQPTLSFGLTMVGVPSGRFQRDSTPENISLVSAFKMSTCEITRAQFSALLGTDPAASANSTGTSDPVQMTNWYHAIAFCNKLSLAEGLTPVYSVTGVNFNTLTYNEIPTVANDNWNATAATWTNSGYRLPTEMEWMWAAMGAPADGRGSGTNNTGYLKGYAGSIEGAGQTNIGNYVWYSTNSPTTTRPVGTRTGNELGLFDMSGNVWEWCWDWNGTYPSNTLTDYQGSTLIDSRVVRGGCVANTAVSCTVANRHKILPHGQSTIGFRVVRR